MHRPDIASRSMLSPMAATAAIQGSTRPTAALMSSAGTSGNGFGALFGEVADFIANGSPASASASAYSVSMPFADPAQAESAASSPLNASNPSDAASRQQFLARISPWAEEAGASLGVSPEIVAAHAALESGWGRHPLRAPGGSDTHNLFGIKAGGAWRGDVASASTTEHEAGADVRKTERFRAYPDQATAFRDYTQLLSTDPRYRAALHTGNDAQAFARGLVQGGYATDPAYADKLARTATSIATRIQSGE